MNPMTEAREAIQTALEPLGVTLYGAPPETVTPPAALVMAADGWAKPLTYGKTEVALVVTLLASMSGSNRSAMERLEDLAWRARTTLAEVCQVGSLGAPRLQKIGTAEVAAADLSIIVHVTDN